MPKCKNCESEYSVRNGKVRGKQRYRCKECGFNFVVGDARTNDKIAAKKAMLILLYFSKRNSLCDNIMKFFVKNVRRKEKWIGKCRISG